MPTADELRAELVAQEGKEREAAAGAAEEPVLDQVKTLVKDSGLTFVDAVRQVASNLKEAGKIGEADIVSSGESVGVSATILKLIGEIVDKL